jgi:uncharacterized protein YjiK
MRSTRLNLCLVVLATASCGFPLLPALPPGGDDDGTSNGGPPTLELLAGNPEGAGSVDGTGADARFDFPLAVTVDGAGNVYVADTTNSTIRKVTPAGVVTTLAGIAGTLGSADGTGADARFGEPFGVTVDSAGNVYVADTDNNTLRKITPAGVVTTLAGTASMVGSADGTGAAARFRRPQAVAVDGAGNVYVADTSNATLRKVTPTGVVTTLAGTASMVGSADGTGAAARFNQPSGVAVDSAGNVYLTDRGNNTLRKVTPAGVVTTLAGTAGMAGSADGTGAAARFNQPIGVAVDSAGNVYVADRGSNTLRKVTPAGVVTTLAGTPNTFGSQDGFGADARFHNPQGAAVDGTGNVYVADTGSSTLRKVTAAGVVTTLAGTAGLAGTTDGTGTAARFDFPIGVAADSAGNLYVTDSNNETLRKITAAGVVTTLAGTARVAGGVDGPGTNASFSAPQGVAVDSAGNIYVADWIGQTIRKVTPAGAVTTLAGTAGMFGSADGTGAAARFNFPQGLAVDKAGNLYVTDENNNTIRKITPAGVVTTLAGTAGVVGSADGTGAAAQFNTPLGVAIDSAGNLYVTEQGNHTVRKITPAGVVTTLAGTAGMTGSVDGTGAAARLNFPAGVAVDAAGNVYVADFRDSTVRKITPTGTTTTIAGLAGSSRVVLGTTPRLAFPFFLTIVGDSIAVIDNNAVLLLRHGARP